MNLQVIKDESGNDTGVFVPMSDWEAISNKHEDLRALLPVRSTVVNKTKLSRLAGTLSNETVDAMLRYVEESRNEWEERLEKQFT